jgi:hypothetical protein
MATQQKRLDFEEFARDLDTIFDILEQEKGPVLIQRAGRIYRLEPEPAGRASDIWIGYDPNAVRRSLRESAGALRLADREVLLSDLHHARGQDTRGRQA